MKFLGTFGGRRISPALRAYAMGAASRPRPTTVPRRGYTVREGRPRAGGNRPARRGRIR